MKRTLYARHRRYGRYIRNRETMVTALTLSAATLSVIVGTPGTFNVVLSPSNASYKDFTLDYDNTKVNCTIAGLVVTVNGLVNGSAVVTVKRGTLSASITVTVTTAVASVTVAPSTATGVAGGTQQLTPTVLPAGASNKSVTYTTSNAAVATVSSTGLITFVAAGTCNITVTTVSGAKTAICAVTVS